MLKGKILPHWWLFCIFIFVSHFGYSKTHWVTNLNNSGSGSLRNKIALTSKGDSVLFIGKLTGEVFLKSKIVIASGITIRGNTAHRIQLKSDSGLTDDALIEVDVPVSDTVRFEFMGFGRSNSRHLKINASSIVYIRNSNFQEASSNSNGGSIYSEGVLAMKRVSFYRNSSSNNGSAVYQLGNRMFLVNCVFLENTAIGKGTVYSENGQGIFLNNTFTENKADDFGKDVYLLNSIDIELSNNLMNSGNGSGSSCFTKVGGNVFSSKGNCIEQQDYEIFKVDEWLNSILNMHLGKAYQNAFGMWVVPLLENSICIDKGIVGLVDVFNLKYDINSANRKLDGVNSGIALPDAGAFEYNRNVITTSNKNDLDDILDGLTQNNNTISFYIDPDQTKTHVLQLKRQHSFGFKVYFVGVSQPNSKIPTTITQTWPIEIEVADDAGITLLNNSGGSIISGIHFRKEIGEILTVKSQQNQSDIYWNKFEGLKKKSKGIVLEGALNIEIGLDLPVFSNVIIGHEIGLEINGNSNFIQNNYIGIDHDGSSKNGNTLGIVVSGENNLIGGSCIYQGNLIGNNDIGISIEGVNAIDNRVLSNIIGLDCAELNVSPNGIGISIKEGAENTLISQGMNGIGLYSGNVIAGNLSHGIEINSSLNSSSKTWIRRNNFGISSSKIEFPNGGNGIQITKLDGVTVDARIIKNNIAKNLESGVHLEIGEAQIYGNLIGSDPNSSETNGNSKAGIRVSNNANSIAIGKLGNGNVIHGNSIGIEVESGSQVSILYNEIYNNIGKGIHIEKDENEGIVAPENFHLKVCEEDVVEFIIDSTGLMNEEFIFQFFKVFNSDKEENGYGEGEFYVTTILSVDMTLKGKNLHYSFPDVADGENYIFSFILTDERGNSSEFSINKLREEIISTRLLNVYDACVGEVGSVELIPNALNCFNLDYEFTVRQGTVIKDPSSLLPGDYLVEVLCGCPVEKEFTIGTKSIKYEVQTIPDNCSAGIGEIKVLAESVDIANWSFRINEESEFSVNPQFDQLNHGIFPLEIKDNEGCVYKEEVEVISDGVRPIETNVPEFIEVCANDQILIEGEEQNYSWYLTDDTTGIPYSTGKQFSISTDNVIDKIYVIEDSSCLGFSREIQINYFSLDPSLVTNEYEVCLFDSVEISYSGLGTYKWFAENGTILMENEGFYVNTFKDISYKLEVIEDGCTYREDISVLVLKDEAFCDLKVPNAFSPNNDGANDVWIVEVLENYPRNRVIVFNRWGGQVTEIENYSRTNAWDGTMENGQKVPYGTYFYMIELNNGQNKKSGWVQITE